MTLAPPQSHPQYGVTQLIYVLHGLSLVIGIVGTATIIGAFLFGWPSIIAVIINYVKRGDVRGTWLESHFRWQIRTFWFGLLWVVLCGLFVALTLGRLEIITGMTVQVMFDPTDWPNERQHEVVDAELRPLFRPAHLPADLAHPASDNRLSRITASP